MDFNKLMNDSKAVVSATHANAKEEAPKSDIKILYPFASGPIEFRLLPNNKTNTVQRDICRHKIPDSSNQYGSKNLICSSFHYPGHDCPVCKAIKNAQVVNGKDCDAYRKFGPKTRGIAYAVIVNIDPSYKDVKPGDLVLLMYPKSIYTEIANILVQNESNLEYIFNKNEGCTFVLETLKTSSFPEYKIKLNVGFNGPVMAKVKNTQEEYDAFLDTIPSLDNAIVPSEMPENLYNDALAAADLVNVTYGCVSEAVSTVNNTNGTTLGNITPKKDNLDFVDTTPTNNWVAPGTTVTAASVGWNVPTQQVVNPTPSSNGNPQCFGQHDDSSQKCMMCPYEMQCMGL